MSQRKALIELTDWEKKLLKQPVTRVSAGPLGVRGSLSGLDTLSEERFEGDDHYLVQLWLGTKPDAARIVKARPPDER